MPDLPPRSPAPLRVLHLAGSAVDEFYADVSRLYASDCLGAVADPARYEHHVAYVSPDGSWRFPGDLSADAIAAAPATTLADAVDTVAGLDVDVMVPQMFCRPGMTHYRALFDLLGVPYLGNRPAVMAVGADKAQASAVVARAGVRVPEAQVVRPGDALALDLPVVVKPVDADNSLGLTLLREADGFEAAVAAAVEHDGAGRALVETYVELGREVRCGVVDVDGELRCLPLEEYAVDATSKPVRDRDDKLRRSEDGDLALVAKDAEHAWILAPTDPPDPVTAAVHEAALRCYEALGCRHYGLFDFRIDPDGTPFFLEAGLYCSYARSSVVVAMAAAAGITLTELFEAGVACVLPSVPTASPAAVPTSAPTPAPGG